MKLTAKQERFVEEYLLDLNATQAAIRAGYSRKTAKEAGYENLTKPHVAEAVNARKAERTQRAEINADYVIQRLAVEAEREGEGASHSARVAALGHLRNHFATQPGAEDVAAPLNITINTVEPVGDIRVTKSND